MDTRAWVYKRRMRSLEGKIVLITGASSGIGRATAFAFAGAGSAAAAVCAASGAAAGAGSAADGGGRSGSLALPAGCARSRSSRCGHRGSAGGLEGHRRSGQQCGAEPRAGQTLRGRPGELGRDDRHQREGAALRSPARWFLEWWRGERGTSSTWARPLGT